VNAAGDATWLRIGATNMPNPATVSIRPMALSGRRRHAISPHATKEIPASRWTIEKPGTGGPRSVSTGLSATAPAAAPATHSASQNQTLWVGAANRRSPWTRPSANGRATCSLVASAQLIKRVIACSRL
jgi:hypothetical protein